MALRKQVRVMEVELMQARLSGLAGGFGFGAGGGGRGLGMDGGQGDASGKAHRDELKEVADLQRCERVMMYGYSSSSLSWP